MCHSKSQLKGAQPGWHIRARTGGAGSWRLEGQRKNMGTKLRALAWHWKSRRRFSLGLSLHLHFYTFNGETKQTPSSKHCHSLLPFIYSTLPTPHVFTGYTATEGLQRSSNVTSWKTLDLTFKRSQRKGKDPYISNS